MSWEILLKYLLLNFCWPDSNASSDILLGWCNSNEIKHDSWINSWFSASEVIDCLKRNHIWPPISREKKHEITRHLRVQIFKTFFPNHIFYQEKNDGKKVVAYQDGRHQLMYSSLSGRSTKQNHAMHYKEEIQSQTTSLVDLSDWKCLKTLSSWKRGNAQDKNALQWTGVYDSTFIVP